VERLDRLIREIKSKYHAPSMGKPKGGATPCCDVLVAAHGHILRAFAMRWIDKPLTHTAFLLEAGGVGTLRCVFCLYRPSSATASASLLGSADSSDSYEHHNIDEPAILLGGGFVVGQSI
jgi:sedoheptulose-bisphosphatase